MKPVIGITPSAQVETLVHGTFLRYCLSAPYVRAIEEAGGIPMILPPQHDTAALVNLIDGLLLSGGPDIDPSRYGDSSVHPATYGIDPERDEFELRLFAAAIDRDIPVFGICRGIQVINVGLGGTLIQDVASQHGGAAEIGHRQHERGLEDHAVGHHVSAADPTLLPIFTDGGLGVNSFHHQAIRDLAPNLTAVALSPDGLVEVVAMPGNCCVFGVQWHPELMFERHPEHLRPFRHLVASAVAHKLAGATI